MVVAGGSGARFGGYKQFALLGGRQVVDWSLDAANRACAGVVLVVPAAASGRDRYRDQGGLCRGRGRDPDGIGACRAGGRAR